MSALSPKLRQATDGMLLFWCPGCDGAHGIRVRQDGAPRPSWEWNGSAEKPTFTPSILVTSRDFTPQGRADYDAWYALPEPRPAHAKFDAADTVCHSFVADGRIQFLGDCTHALANQTVDIPDFDTAHLVP